MFIKKCTELSLNIRPNFYLCLSVNKDNGLFTYSIFSNNETPRSSYPLLLPLFTVQWRSTWWL